MKNDEKQLVPIMIRDMGDRIENANATEKFNLIARLRATKKYCEEILKRFL